MTYLFLILGALATLTYTVSRPGVRLSLVPATVALGSSIGLVDLLASVVLQLYTFHPGLLPDGRDTILGAFLADFLFVPILFGCLLVLFPRHRVSVVIAMTALLGAIEWAFLQTGLVAHNGWHVFYTVVLFGLRFGIAAWWLTHFERVGYTPGFRYLLTSSALTYGWWIFSVPTSGLLVIWEVRLNLLSLPEMDRVLGMFLVLGLPLYAVGFAAVWFRWSQSLWGLVAVGTGWAGYLYTLEALGLWRRHPFWSPIYQATLITAILWATTWLDAWWTERRPARAGVR